MEEPIYVSVAELVYAPASSTGIERYEGSNPSTDTNKYPTGSGQKMREIRLYNGKAYGHEVSRYGLEHGYLDYLTLSKIIGDCILNNTIREETMNDWDIVAGEFVSAVFQDYIISENGYKFLEEYTDELVFYNYILDIYVWAVTHFGTSWDYVLTDIKLIGEDEKND